MLNGKLYGDLVANSIGSSIVDLQTSLIRVLSIVWPLDCGALITTVVDWCDVVMGVMLGSSGIMDLIGLLNVSLASPVFSIDIFKGDDVWFWL